MFRERKVKVTDSVTDGQVFIRASKDLRTKNIRFVKYLYTNTGSVFGIRFEKMNNFEGHPFKNTTTVYSIVGA